MIRNILLIDIQKGPPMMELRKRIDSLPLFSAKIVSILIFPLAVMLFPHPLPAESGKIGIAGLQIKSAMNVHSIATGDTRFSHRDAKSISKTSGWESTGHGGQYLLAQLDKTSTPAAATVSPEGSLLREGVRQYQEENFEEAIDILKQAREKEPESSTAAFFLGMAYKQTMDFSNAALHLEAAVTLFPHIREALTQLIDALYQIEKFPEAKKWIQVAEQEGISLPDVTYVKGLILAKENKNQEAIEAFEKAKKLNPEMSQSADFQIALCYVRDRKLEKAKERLTVAVLHNPSSDLATYARQYQDLVEKGLYLERPLRLTVGLMGGYDSNVIAKPVDASVAGDITDEGASVLQSSVRVDYIPKLDGPWFFNANYTFNSKLHSRFSTTHDNMANTISVTPGYNFGRSALNLTASYTNALIRTDPDLFPTGDSPGYKRYMDYWTAGPAFRFMATQEHIFEIFGGYDIKRYDNQKPTSEENNRDSAGPRAYLSWMWFFTQDAFVNLRYDYTAENTDGAWAKNDTHRFTVNTIIPLLSEPTAERFGQVSLQVSAGATFQDYKNEQPYLDRDFEIKMAVRRDRTYTGSVGLTWEIYKYVSLLVQYTYTQNDSNMPTNEYKRNVYLGGMEFRF
jgi:tetratricopeptide (TPR) repeat protein